MNKTKLYVLLIFLVSIISSPLLIFISNNFDLKSPYISQEHKDNIILAYQNPKTSISTITCTNITFSSNPLTPTEIKIDKNYCNSYSKYEPQSFYIYVALEANTIYLFNTKGGRLNEFRLYLDIGYTNAIFSSIDNEGIPFILIPRYKILYVINWTYERGTYHPSEIGVFRADYYDEEECIEGESSKQKEDGSNIFSFEVPDLSTCASEDDFTLELPDAQFISDPRWFRIKDDYYDTIIPIWDWGENAIFSDEIGDLKEEIYDHQDSNFFVYTDDDGELKITIPDPSYWESIDLIFVGNVVLVSAITICIGGFLYLLYRRYLAKKSSNSKEVTNIENKDLDKKNQLI
ncbi:MAG: hypothetical protein ACFFAN_17415 [Promethearchaeota archaeon]